MTTTYDSKEVAAFTGSEAMIAPENDWRQTPYHSQIDLPRTDEEDRATQPMVLTAAERNVYRRD
jgi:hypothetical protein